MHTTTANNIELADSFLLPYGSTLPSKWSVEETDEK